MAENPLPCVMTAKGDGSGGGGTRIVNVSLPVPPSANNLFFNVAGRGRVRTPRYRAWAAEAAILLVGQPSLDCPVSLRVRVHGGKGFPVSRDLDNVLKALQDALKAAGCIASDDVRTVREIVATYHPSLDKTAISSVTVSVEQWEGEA